MCLAVMGRLQGRTAKLLLARWISRYYGTNLTYNGTAIKGGCVTRRKHRAGSCTLAGKLSRCKEGMARVFAVRVQVLLSITSVAVQGY